MSSKIDGVPRELLERLQSQTELSNDWDEVQALLAAPVVERQPVAYRYKESHASWENEKPWEPTTLEHGAVLLERKALAANGTFKGDSQAYYLALTVEPLYTSPPAPVAVLHFVCDRIPDQNGCTFIECENSEGSSINAGEWVVRPDGLAQLVVSRPPLKLPEYKRPPPGCVITQEMAAHNACLDKVKDLNQC